MDAKHARAAVVDDIGEIVGGQTIVDGNEHGADLRHGIERLELRMGIGRDIGDAVAGLDPHLLQRGGPAIAAVKELRVGQPEIAVDDSFPVGIEPARASRKFHWRQGDFHWGRPPSATFGCIAPLESFARYDRQFWPKTAEFPGFWQQPRMTEAQGQSSRSGSTARAALPRFGGPTIKISRARTCKAIAPGGHRNDDANAAA